MSDIQELLTRIKQSPANKENIARTLSIFSSSHKNLTLDDITVLETDPYIEKLPADILNEVTTFINSLSTNCDETIVRTDDKTRILLHSAKYPTTNDITSVEVAIDASLVHANEAPAPQETLKNRFVLVDKLGYGGMGTVYKARDLRKEEAEDNNPYLALKVLNSDFKDHPDAFKGLQRETQKSQTLAHPNIVNVYDFDRDGDTIFMTMELLEGDTLKEVIRDNPAGLSLSEATPIIEGLFQALAYAHKNHIVHADFKPGNVFIINKKHAKVLDFGIAQAASNANEVIKKEDSFNASNFGAYTPSYATKEMVEGKPLEPTDDIYSLACVIYEILSGTHPYKRQSAVDAEKNRLKAQPIRKLKRRQWLTLLSGLSLDRSSRLKSVEDFEDGFLLTNRKRNRILVVIGILIAAVAGSMSFFLKPEAIDSIPSLVELTMDEQNTITTLLDTAELYISIGQLASPPGDSALDLYDKILEIDSSNRAAIDGKIFIAGEYEKLAQMALNSGDETLAKSYINTGLQSMPTHEGLKNLRDKKVN